MWIRQLMKPSGLCHAVIRPPLRYECTPCRPLGVGLLVEVGEVAEKAGDVRDVQDPAHHLRPALEHPQRAAAFRPSRNDPGLDQGEEGPDQSVAVGSRPNSNVLVPEVFSEPRTINPGVESDADGPPRHF